MIDNKELTIVYLPGIDLKYVVSAVGNLAGFSADSRFHQVMFLGYGIEGVQERISAYHQDQVKQDPKICDDLRKSDFTVTPVGKYGYNEYGIEFNPEIVDIQEIKEENILNEARRILRALGVPYPKR